MRMDIGTRPEIGTWGFLAGGLLPGAGLRTGTVRRGPISRLRPSRGRR